MRMQTKTLSHIVKSQSDEIYQAEEHRSRSREYGILVDAVMKKVSAAELSEHHPTPILINGHDQF